MITSSKPVIGMCDGVFDMMHIGHIRHLEACKAMCDFLVVAVACDEYAKNKGKDRPIVDEMNRFIAVKALRCVDKVFICDGSVAAVNYIMPDLYFKNYDYRIDKDLNPSIKIVRMPVYGSTTSLIEKIGRINE